MDDRKNWSGQLPNAILGAIQECSQALMLKDDWLAIKESRKLRHGKEGVEQEDEEHDSASSKHTGTVLYKKHSLTETILFALPCLRQIVEQTSDDESLEDQE